MTSARRVVFDCNTLLQGLASPDGPAGECVQIAIDRKVDLFVSPKVLDELRDVASRPKVIDKLHLTPDRTEEFIGVIEIAATVLTGFPETFTYSRDPDDAHYVNLAAAANASVIVSRDKDLLDLMDPAKPEAADFRNRFPLLRILDPVSFLREFSQVSQIPDD
jgi:putative PIN family toxin of toxin-antitoxin system